MPKAKGSSFRIPRPRGVLPGSIAKVVRGATTKRGLAEASRGFRQARAGSAGKVTKKEQHQINRLVSLVKTESGRKAAKTAKRKLMGRASTVYKGKKGGKKK